MEGCKNKANKNTPKGSEGSIQSCQPVREPNKHNLNIWEGILVG